jgi:hypothetical protein
MSFTNHATADELGRTLPGAFPEPIQTQASAVSWGAIIAGAAATSALALILLMLGTGLGLSSVSPWAYNGVNATTFGVSSILWLTFTQLVASGMGGYLAGRLRTKWVDAQLDEVYFRDTAHGFLSWAVATLATAALLTSVIGSIVSGGIQAGATVPGGVATSVGSEKVKFDADSGPIGYFVDSLFRREINTIGIEDQPEHDAIAILMPGAGSKYFSAEARHEIIRIFMNSVHTGPLSAEDIQYVSRMVAHRAGLTQQAAEQRVIDTYTRLQTRLHDAENATKEVG